MKSFFIAPMILSLAVLADGLDQQYDAKVVRHVDGLVNAIKYEYSKAIDQEFDNTQSSDEKEKTLGNSKHFMPHYGMYGMGYGGMGMYGMGYGGMGMYPYYGYGGYYGGMDANPWTMWKRSTDNSPNYKLKQAIKAEFNDQVLKPFRKDALDIVQAETDAFNARGSLEKRNKGEDSSIPPQAPAPPTSEAHVPPTSGGHAPPTSEGHVPPTAGGHVPTGSVPEAAPGRFARMKTSLSNLKSSLGTALSSRIANLQASFENSESALYRYGFNKKMAFRAAMAVLASAVIYFFFRYLFMRNSDEIDE